MTLSKMSLWQGSLCKVQNKHRSHFWYQDGSRRALKMCPPPQHHVKTVLLLHLLPSCVIENEMCQTSLILNHSDQCKCSTQTVWWRRVWLPFLYMFLNFGTFSIIILYFYFPMNVLFMFIFFTCVEEMSYVCWDSLFYTVWSCFVPFRKLRW